MDRSKLRKCKFRVLNHKEKMLDPPQFGYFHEWGVDYEEFEAGPGNNTVGIVEDMEGNIHIIRNPENVSFAPIDGGGSVGVNRNEGIGKIT
jgi:hypothetical protein